MRYASTVRCSRYESLCSGVALSKLFFQSEIAKLLADLQALLVHQWPRDKLNGGTSKSSDSNNCSDLSDLGAPPYSCPHKDCSTSCYTFQRDHDIIRHYGTRMSTLATVAKPSDQH